MKNKGFTLIELLATVAILLAILALIVPKVFKQLKKAENITDKEQINSIINVAKLYTNENTNLLPEENDLNIITLQQLKDSGLIKTNQILNPSTKEELTGCIIVRNTNNKMNYEYTEDKCNKMVTVTLNPNGGELENTTKNVIISEEYGELPTPTRDGYTFMGWNGKNLLNLDLISGIYNSKTGITILDTDIYKSTQLTDNLPIGDYTISSENDISITRIYKNEDKTCVFHGARIIPYTFELTTTSQIGFSFRESESNQKIWSFGENTMDAKIQLERGSTATTYEPYYVTSNILVTQNENHTLKAIWNKNT